MKRNTHSETGEQEKRRRLGSERTELRLKRVIDCDLIVEPFYYKKKKTGECTEIGWQRVSLIFCRSSILCVNYRIKEHHPLNKRKLKRRKMNIEINVHFFLLWGFFWDLKWGWRCCVVEQMLVLLSWRYQSLQPRATFRRDSSEMKRGRKHRENKD